MRKIQRLAAIGAMAALTVALSACGSSEAPSTSSPAPAAPPAAAPPSSVSSDGVTTPADTFGAACGSLPQGNSPGSLNAMGPQPVATAASTNPILKTLVVAVGKAGLVETLNSQRAITVFAPSDMAFAELQKSMGDAKFNALLADKAALGKALTYHVIAKRYDREGLVSAGSVATLAGGNVMVKDAGSTLSVTDGSGQTANVLCGNIPTSNATVFVIDKVMMATKS